jgi:outer membrane protein
LGEREQRDYLLQDEPAQTNAPADAGLLVQTALRNRPDLAQSRYARDAVEKFARAEKELNYPTVSAAGAVGVIPYHDSALRGNYAAAGLNFSMPLFEGMLFSAREKEAELRAKAATQNVRAAENDAIRDVRLAALNLNYAAERMTLTADLVASANEAFDLAQARYKVQSSSIVELSQAQLSQTQAAIEQARAKYEYQIRNAILNYQTGQLR